MAKNELTSAVVDAVLKTVAMSGNMTIDTLTPNMTINLRKPIRLQFDMLGNIDQTQEMQRIIAYMARTNLVNQDSENRLKLTDRGYKRLRKIKYDALAIPTPSVWDNHWSIVLFDIPGSRDVSRHAFTNKLHLLGFKYYQNSVWVHPFPCRTEIQVVCQALDISQYVTYIRASQIDNEDQLKSSFQDLLVR